MTIAVSQLQKKGRFQPMRVQVQRYDSPNNSYEVYKTAAFKSYRFSQSMLVPVDAFSFSFQPPSKPDNPGSPAIDDLIREGDVVTVHQGDDTDDTMIATGIVDSIGLRSARESETFTINGRDLLGQFEDQDAVTFEDGSGKPKMEYGENVSLKSVIRELAKQTRINGDNVRLQGIQDVRQLLAYSPGESKLSALLRFLEPLNALVWTESDGTIVCGKPNFAQPANLGQFFVRKKDGKSNVIYMQVNKNAGRIPNGVLGIWSGGELAQDAFATGVIQNPATRCTALRKAGHIINKTVVVSVPTSNVQSDGVALNTLRNDASGYVNAYVKRMIARANVGELDVEVLVPGHCNDSGIAYTADTVAHIFNDRAQIDENMYCYAVDYMMDEGGGQSTSLHFCKLGTIVADAEAP